MIELAAGGGSPAEAATGPLNGKGSIHEKGNTAAPRWLPLLVDAHGGRIEVQSAPGQGACFSVLLPMTMIGQPSASRGRFTN
jgi:hypothetical protein